jgi:2,3-diketo-5-methylthio-1-phosphopentane phosphatase
VTDLAIVCDFDGTATVLDIGDEISAHFGGVEHFRLQKKLFAEGKLDTRGIIEGIYTHVRASEKEVREFAVAKAVLRPGFSELIAAARDRQAPFFLASGGLRQYIEAILEAHLPPELRQWVRIRANEAHFSPTGLRVTFPLDAESRSAGCSVCGSCKRISVAQADAKFVIGLGDGFADRCLAQCADQMFAREGSYLHRWCLENGVACTPFTEMFGAAEAVKRHGSC